MPDAYIDGDAYRRHTGSQAAGDPWLDQLLVDASRALDRRLWVAPGMFAPTAATTTFRFDGDGTDRLELRDSRGLQYFLRAVDADGIALDTDADGVFDDYAWDLSDGWVRGLPENAVTFGDAFTSLELLGHLTTAPLKAWPDARDSVRITGSWGFAAVPGAVQVLVADIAHNARQSGLTGGISVPAADDSLPLSSAMWPVLRKLEEAYTRRHQAVA